MINIRGSRLHDQACTACSKGSAWSPFRMTLLNTSTSDAIKPAAAGDGKPTKSPPAARFSFPGTSGFVSTLKRASRTPTQSR